MTGVLLTIEGAAGDASLAFAVPPEFRELDLLADGRTDLDTPLSDARRWLIESMRTGGARYAATLLARTEPEPGTEPVRLTVAQFTVSVVESAPGATSLEAIWQSQQSADPRRAVEIVELDVGPALVVIDEQDVTPSAELPGGGSGGSRPVRQVQVIRPFPSGRALVMFAMATECLSEWGDYLTIMAAITQTIRFTAG